MSQLYAVYYTLNCCSVIRKKVKSLSRVQLFAAPWTVARQAPLSLEFSRQVYWSGLPFPSPQNLSDRAVAVRSPALQAESLPSDPPGKPSIVIKLCPVLWPHELQHASLPCPSPSLWICSSSCPLSWWHHLNHFILCRTLLLLPSIFPSFRVFQMSQFFTSGDKGLELQLQHQSFQWIFRVYFLYDTLYNSNTNFIYITQTVSKR